MRRNTMHWRGTAMGLGILWGLGALAAATPARAATTTRPISDFLVAQGTWAQADPYPGYLFVPPDPNFLGWTNDTDTNNDGVPDRPLLFAGVDYAGLANAYHANIFGTKMSGTVTERPLPDGRTEVTVLLHTTNANAWVIALDLQGDVLDQIANKPTLFGLRPRDIANRANAALADTSLQVVFIHAAPPGAPLPDLLRPGLEVKTLRFTASADGRLHTAFGVPEGTPGRCTIVQNGVLVRGSNGYLVGGDGFPGEIVDLRVIGR